MNSYFNGPMEGAQTALKLENVGFSLNHIAFLPTASQDSSAGMIEDLAAGANFCFRAARDLKALPEAIPNLSGRQLIGITHFPTGSPSSTDNRVALALPHPVRRVVTARSSPTSSLPVASVLAPNSGAEPGRWSCNRSQNGKRQIVRCGRPEPPLRWWWKAPRLRSGPFFSSFQALFSQPATNTSSSGPIPHTRMHSQLAAEPIACPVAASDLLVDSAKKGSSVEPDRRGRIAKKSRRVGGHLRSERMRDRTLIFMPAPS